jgi:hypothetical protein
MSAANIDFHLIKTPLLIFVGSLVVASGLLLGVTLLLDSSRQTFTQINQSVSIDKETLQKRQEGNGLYHALQQKYRSLFANGLNQADKLLWMEQLQIQAERLSLPALSYNIKARQPDADLNAALSDGFSVYATPIEVKAGLLHEGQLLSLADNLVQAGLGTFSFEYCGLKLNEANSVFKPATSNINAECLIKWFEIVRTEDMDAEMAAGVMP